MMKSNRSEGTKYMNIKNKQSDDTKSYLQTAHTVPIFYVREKPTNTSLFYRKMQTAWVDSQILPNERTILSFDTFHSFIFVHTAL